VMKPYILSSGITQPRWESMREYATLIGFDLDSALEVIEAMPRLYCETYVHDTSVKSFRSALESYAKFSRARLPGKIPEGRGVRHGNMVKFLGSRFLTPW